LAMVARVWAKFIWDRALFIRVPDPTHRGDEVLQFLSSNQTQIRLCLEDIVKGAILGLVMIWEQTLGRVRVTLSGWVSLDTRSVMARSRVGRFSRLSRASLKLFL
jgi:membrane protein YqaA with SNARE-associated domain